MALLFSDGRLDFTDLNWLRSTPAAPGSSLRPDGAPASSKWTEGTRIGLLFRVDWPLHISLKTTGGTPPASLATLNNSYRAPNHEEFMNEMNRGGKAFPGNFSVANRLVM